MKNKKSNVIKKPQFTLSKCLHRIQKFQILMDVVIEDEVVQDYPVGWVKVRGADDPVYTKIAIPALFEYREAIKEAEDIEDLEERAAFLKDATVLLNVTSMTSAITDWDEAFFEMPYTPENATEVFSQDKYILVYNQVATYIQDRVNFLPLVSIQQENG
jgi:hypothetical protein